MEKCRDPNARMASICAILQHKMDSFFWTGFYLLKQEELLVSTYQGPLACMQLKEGEGVCWAAIKQAETIIVPDVEKFPGHIACDSRSKSEIAMPLYNANKEIIGALDVDSSNYNNFDEIDAVELEKILNLIFV
jgi:GAF domain-containing protein